MRERLIAEGDIQAVLALLECIPDDGANKNVRTTLEAAPHRRIDPGGEVRQVLLRSVSEADWLRQKIEDYLRHGKPDVSRRAAMNRVLAKLYSSTT